MSAERFVLVAHGQVVHNPILNFCLCDLRLCLARLFDDTNSSFLYPTSKTRMQDSLDRAPNKPRCIIRVLDLKIIRYFPNALSSKQALRTPTVL